MREIAKWQAREKLDEEVGKISEAGGDVAGAHAPIGRPDAEIAHLAKEIGAGLVVVGSRGLGPLTRAVIGSVSESVVRHTHCPVLVVRGYGDEDKDYCYAAPKRFRSKAPATKAIAAAAPPVSSVSSVSP